MFLRDSIDACLHSFVNGLYICDPQVINEEQKDEIERLHKDGGKWKAVPRLLDFVALKGEKGLKQLMLEYEEVKLADAANFLHQEFEKQRRKLPSESRQASSSLKAASYPSLDTKMMQIHASSPSLSQHKCNI